MADPKTIANVLRDPQYWADFSAHASRLLGGDENRTRALASALLSGDLHGALRTANENANSSLDKSIGMLTSGKIDDALQAGIGMLGVTKMIGGFPNEISKKAWELGLKHREMQGKFNSVHDMYENIPNEELNFISDMEGRYPLLRAFYESARRGAEKPKFTRGVRFGEAPKHGYSMNHVDGTQELGVSMGSVDGLKYQWYPMGKFGSPVKYQGWLLDPDVFRGSDGEPLMVGLKKS